MPPLRRRGERGLTLLELLIAMTLLGMLMAAMTGGLRLGARIWDRSQVSLDESNRMAVLSGFLKDRLEQAQPITLDQPGSAAQPIFRGRPDSLKMVSAMPISLGGSLFVIELERVSRQGFGSSSDLVMRWQPFERAGRRLGGRGERRLIEQVFELRLRYFGAKAGARAGWHDSWEHEPSLPRLIEIDIRFKKRNREADMTLFAATLVDEWYDITL